MTKWDVACIDKGYALLPPKLNSPLATNELLAIGYQESRFIHRAQIVIVNGEKRKGPARGDWQFERMGGVNGVLEHKSTKILIRDAMLTLSYPSNMDSRACWGAIETDDTLAFCFARLLLYASPKRLPKLNEMNHGWNCYIDAWRPGKPHPNTWVDAWSFAATHNPKD